MDELLTTKEVLEILKISKLSLYRKIWAGEIKAYKLGRLWRFKREDIEKCLRENKPEGK